MVVLICSACGPFVFKINYFLSLLIYFKDVIGVLEDEREAMVVIEGLGASCYSFSTQVFIKS